MTNIVMTGATTGIGAAAAQRLARPGVRLITGSRSGSGPSGAEVLPLDLASLASVNAFAGAVTAALAGGGIDALVLNAGGQRPDLDARSADGFELTFATNHLAHYLLLRRLAPLLNTGARVVITASGTHDPAENTGLPPPRHAEAFLLANPARDPGVGGRFPGLHAYTASKLANVMTALVFAGSAEARDRRLVVTAYDPGLTPGTGLVRDQMWVVRTLVWPLLPLLQPFRSGMNSLDAAGRGLADLATTEVPPPGRVYASLRKARLTWPDPSELARDPVAAAKLWAESADLVGFG
jgi:NAD(P)-dependent dehydrogenase (short-subunit alcohol dehydrogenase family)